MTAMDAKAMDAKAVDAKAVDAKAAAVTGTAAWRVRWRRRVRGFEIDGRGRDDDRGGGGGRQGLRLWYKTQA